MKFYVMAIVMLVTAAICHPNMVSARRTPPPHDEDPIIIPRKFYSANALDGIIFSTALMERPGSSTQLTTLRFSMLNFGINLHYDFSPGFGIFSGVGIKNIGFIEQFDTPDYTRKHRVYSLGVPLGIKIGKLKERTFLFLGGGVDLPVHYKVKWFADRNDKEKFSEWFSTATPRVMPYVFAGYSFDPGLTVKLQYYPTNFLNEDYSDLIGSPGRTFNGYKVNLILLSLGIDIHYNVLPKEIPKKH
jgi:hypothetical protein